MCNRGNLSSPPPQWLVWLTKRLENLFPLRRKRKVSFQSIAFGRLFRFGSRSLAKFHVNSDGNLLINATPQLKRNNRKINKRPPRGISASTDTSFANLNKVPLRRMPVFMN